MANKFPHNNENAKFGCVTLNRFVPFILTIMSNQQNIVTFFYPPITKNAQPEPRTKNAFLRLSLHKPLTEAIHDGCQFGGCVFAMSKRRTLRA